MFAHPHGLDPFKVALRGQFDITSVQGAKQAWNKPIPL
jgi:hypothetical protein